jgi:hypothetical protein
VEDNEVKELLVKLHSRFDRMEVQQTRVGDTMVPLVSALNNNSMAQDRNTKELQSVKETFSRSMPTSVVYIIVSALVVVVILQAFDKSKFNNVTGNSPVGGFSASQ